MTRSIRVETEGGLGEALDRIQNELTLELKIAMVSAQSEIVRRTHSGLDENERPFAEYSKSYKAELEAEGESTDVDLRRTGLMLRGMNTIVKRIKDNTLEGLIFFNNAKAAERAQDNISPKNPRKKSRRFFGLSKKQSERIKAQMRAALKRLR